MGALRTRLNHAERNTRLDGEHTLHVLPLPQRELNITRQRIALECDAMGVIGHEGQEHRDREQAHEREDIFGRRKFRGGLDDHRLGGLPFASCQP